MENSDSCEELLFRKIGIQGDLEAIPGEFSAHIVQDLGVDISSVVRSGADHYIEPDALLFFHEIETVHLFPALHAFTLNSRRFIRS